MYLHQISDKVAAGSEVRRGAWPEGHFMKKLDKVSLDEAIRKAVGLNKNASIETGEVYLYVAGKYSATLGFKVSSEDAGAQDWEMLLQDAPAEAE